MVDQVVAMTLTRRRIVLSVEDKLDYLEHPIPPAPVSAQAGQQVALKALAAHAAWVKGSKEIIGLMLMTMESDIQLNLENLGAYEMLQELKTLFAQQAEHFVQNYNMHGMGKTDNELHAMLKLHEQTLTNKAPVLHVIQAGKHATVEATGSFHLCLPSGLVIVLNNYHYAPSITRGVILVLRLYNDGYVNRFVDNTIQVFRNNMVYFSAVPRDAFQKEVEHQLSKTIKSLRSDHEGEYMSQEFLDHIKEHVIIAHRTPPYTPQYNGVSERRNGTLLDMVEKTPYEVWHGQALKLSYLKVWGCEALVKRDTLTKPDKLKPKSIKCVFVGYIKKTIGYSFYYPPKNKVLVARNAEFLENSLITQEASGSFEDLKIIQEEDTHPSINTSSHHEDDDLEINEHQSDIIPIHRSTKTRHAPDRMCLYVDVEEHELGDLGEPTNYKAALLDLKSDKWMNAMNVEMQSMKDNEV
nr:hypothetical protein [Tanacetum cinerariifolium]